MITTRFHRAITSEFEAFHPVVAINRLIARLVPAYSGYRVRTAILRIRRMAHRPHGVLRRRPRTGRGRARSSGDCRSGRTVGSTSAVDSISAMTSPSDRGVAIGHDVMIMTSTHRLGGHLRRAGELTTAPVTIEQGAWIGARAVILPGRERSGAGAVVAAGAVVTQRRARRTSWSAVYPPEELRAAVTSRLPASMSPSSSRRTTAATGCGGSSRRSIGKSPPPRDGRTFTFDVVVVSDGSTDDTVEMARVARNELHPQRRSSRRTLVRRAPAIAASRQRPDASSSSSTTTSYLRQVASRRTSHVTTRRPIWSSSVRCSRRRTSS